MLEKSAIQLPKYKSEQPEQSLSIIALEGDSLATDELQLLIEESISLQGRILGIIKTMKENEESFDALQWQSIYYSVVDAVLIYKMLFSRAKGAQVTKGLTEKSNNILFRIGGQLKMP